MAVDPVTCVTLLAVTSLADLRTSQLLFIETFKEILFHLSSKCLERTPTGLTCVQESKIVEVLSNFAKMDDATRKVNVRLLIDVLNILTCHIQMKLVLPVAPGVIIINFVIAAPLCSSNAIVKLWLQVAARADRWLVFAWRKARLI
jgi:hypothetical protein